MVRRWSVAVDRWSCDGPSSLATVDCRHSPPLTGGGSGIRGTIAIRGLDKEASRMMTWRIVVGGSQE
ncbi:hypothetical protein Tco_0392744 [Tanacetum coccineum]